MSGDDAARPRSERHERVRALFLAAGRVPQGERTAFVEREAEGDAALAAEVRALLAHDDPDESFISKPALAAAEALAAIPKRIGSYAVRAKIGEGGMGAVFEAMQENPRRIVAVKVLHFSVATEATRQRFEREARLLARLHHPGIAQIFEAGEADTDFGRQPYLVMERVDGFPVTEHASQKGLDTSARLELFARVCDAVQHAHDRGVVHRDLKPANVLVDGSGQPKILDFGIARLLEHDERMTSTLTGEDAILGTVPYLSPEQASGRAHEIDGRADVYSLGVLLYELLTGDLPFDVRARPAAEALRIVLDRDPTPPGSRLKALRGDVETILGKAMEKDRARRYATPAAFASDIRRHLRSEPIAARPPSALYRARKFARRNSALVGGGLATIAALTAGGALATKFAFDEHAARERADRNAYRSGVLLAASALAAEDFTAARSALDGTPEALRGFEWKHLRQALDGSLAVFDLAARQRFVEALAFSADGSRLLVGTQYGLRVVAIDQDTGSAAPLDFDVGAGGALVAAFGPGAETFLASGDEPSTVALRRSGSGEVLSELGAYQHSIVSGAISPRGNRCVVSTGGDDVELWDTSPPAGKSIGRWRFSAHWRARSAFSPDGSLVAFGSGDGLVRVVDADSGAERVGLRESDRVSGLAFSPDGALLAVGFGPEYSSPGAGVSIYDVQTGALARRFQFDGMVCALAFTPDGARLAIGRSHGAVHVVDVTTGERTARHLSSGSFVNALAFSPDATLLAAGTTDGKVALFLADLDADAAAHLCAHTSYVYGCAISPDGKTIASAAWDHTVRLWDAASASEIAVLRGHSNYLRRVEFDPSGRALLTVSGDRTYRIWDATTGREISRWSDVDAWLVGATFSPDGRFLVISTDHPEWQLYVKDISSGDVVARAPTACGALSVDPRGGSVAALTNDGSVRLHELPSLALLRSSPAPVAGLSASAYSIAHSSDGERLALGRYGLVEVLDAATLEVLSTTPVSGGETFAARFSPDGERIATGSRDGRLRLIDSRSGEIVASLLGHRDYVYDLAWSPEGNYLVTASGDKTLRIWETAPASERLRARLAAERSRAAVAPRVRALYAELVDAEAVAARIESDPALSPDERAALLRETLRQRP